MTVVGVWGSFEAIDLVFACRYTDPPKEKLQNLTACSASHPNYAQWCGRTLALSHSRSGTPAVLSGYMGSSDAFDRAVAAFSVAYADQNERDYAILKRAVRAKKLPAEFEKDR